MTTKAEQIVLAIEALLKAAPQTPAEDRVYRNREDPLLRDTSPAISLIKRSDTPQLPGATGRTQWLLLLELKVVGSNAAAPDSAVDATLEAIHSKLYTDRSLGGLAVDIVVGGVTYTQDGEIKEVCTAVREYSVTYQTAEESLTNL